MALMNWTRRVQAPAPSEQQLLQLFNSLSDVVLAIDEHQHIVTVNNAWKGITGVDAGEAIARPFSEFLHPEDIGNWKRLLDKVSVGKTELIWLRMLNQQGEIHWCEMRVQPINNDRKYPVSATLCDITPQVRSDQVRDANHRSLQSLVDRIPAMLYRARNNVSWTMEYVSSGCELVTGYSAESLLNQSQISLGSMIHADDAPQVWDDVQTALGLLQPFDLHYRITRADGTEMRVRDRGQGLYSESGLVMGVEGIILQAAEE